MTTSIPDKKQLVIDAARQLLATRGVHGMSMKLLVESSKVPAGTIYLHFKDKQDILRQVHSSILTEVARAMAEGHDPSLSAFDQYRNLWLNLWNYLTQHRNTLQVKSQFDHLPAGAIKEDLDEARASFKPLTDLFETGRASGELKNLPDAVLGGLSLETCPTLARQGVLGMVEFDDQLLDDCIHASWQAIAQSSANAPAAESKQ